MPPVPVVSLPSSAARQPQPLERLRGLSHLLDPAALVSIARAVYATRSRLYWRTGVPLPSITQLSLALRFYCAREDEKRLAEVQERARAQLNPGEVVGDGEMEGASERNTEGEAERGFVVSEAKGRAVVEACREKDELDGGASEALHKYKEHLKNCRRSDGRRFSGDKDTPLPDEGSSSSNPISEHVRPEQLREATWTPGANNEIYLRKVHHLCHLARAAYASSIDNMKEAFLPSIDAALVLASKWTAEKCSPAYFVYFDVSLNALVVSIRGTKDIPDMITNLSVETLPFCANPSISRHVGYGHAGVIRSARKLNTSLFRLLARALGPTYNRPACIPSSYIDKKLIITGHSLGGAVASVLALILPNRSFPNIECIAFAAPPCLSPDLSAPLAAGPPITMVMYGLDIVPRLSVSSLERLLEKVSRYDWRRDAGASAERWIRSFASASSGPAAATEADSAGSGMLGQVAAVVREHGVDGVVWALEGVHDLTTRSMEADARQEGQGPTWGWNVARAATAFLSGWMASQLRAPEDPGGIGRAGQRRTTGYGRVFGMSDEQVETALGSENAVHVKELTVLGRILHFVEDKAEEELTITERSPRDLKAIEASLEMIYDHEPERILEATGRLIGSSECLTSTSETEGNRKGETGWGP